jgi:molybdate transport repressor ModE-like protein
MKPARDMRERSVETRQEKTLPVRARVKLTLCRDDRFFGPGVCELLERIRKTGSIQAAAAQMEMSYSKAWKILNHAEEEMGIELITRVSGGRNGGSSKLTEAGEDAVREFREMEAKLSAYAEELMKTRRSLFTRETHGGSAWKQKQD